MATRPAASPVPRPRRALAWGGLAASLAGALAGAVLLAAPGPREAFANDAPVLRSVNPTSVLRGGTHDVVLEGRNLHPYDELSLSRNDVSATVQAGANANRLVVRLVVPSNVPAGPLTLALKTKNGVAKRDVAIRLRSPVVTRVTPAEVVRGGDYEVRLDGAFLAFQGEETLLSVEAPMTAKLAPRPAEKTLTLKVTVPPDTPPGPRPITLETSDGKVTTTLVVALAVPALTALAPDTVARGASADCVVTGRNLLGAQAVRLAVDDPEVRVSLGTPTRTSLPLKVEATVAAQAGPRVFVVTTPDGVVSGAFTVTTPVPALTALRPAGAARGESALVTPIVANAPGPYTLRVVPEGDGVALEPQSGGAYRFVVAQHAAPGPRTVVLDHPFGTAVASFLVSAKAPTLTAFTPGDLPPGGEGDVAFEGQWLEGATVEPAAPDLGLEIATKGPGVLRVKVAADARPGPRPLVVRTADGATVASFVVRGTGTVAPAVSTTLPARIGRGGPAEVTLTGMNLRSAGDQPPSVSATAVGRPIPASIVASTATAAKVRLEVPADLEAGPCVIVLTTSDGTAAGITLVAPSRPVVREVRATVAPRPGDLPFEILGSDLVGPGDARPGVVLMRPDGSDPLPGTVTSATSGRLVVAVPVLAGSVPGPRVLVVTTSEGAAAAAAAIPAFVPAVTRLVPTTVGVSANLTLTVEGRHLLGPGGVAPVAAVTRLGAPATVRSEVLEATATTARVRVTTAPGTAAGPHVLTLKTADGVAAAVFTVVNAPMPVLRSMAPASGGRLQTVTVVLEGTGLTGTTAVEFSGEGVTAAIQPGGTDTKVLLRVTVAKDAAPGVRTVTLFAPGGQAEGGNLVFKVE